MVACTVAAMEHHIVFCGKCATFIHHCIDGKMNQYWSLNRPSKLFIAASCMVISAVSGFV
jgi:hypothetical protein